MQQTHAWIGLIWLTNRKLIYIIDDMDIASLTERMNRFVAEQGWYEPDSPKPQTLRNLAISLSLETAEVLEHFQWQDQGLNPDEMGEELADVALYLLQIASVAGIDLEQAILDKLARNYSRDWEG
jgi:NTP pyrophosphatase (non-canonical NTP hydrolase)